MVNACKYRRFLSRCGRPSTGSCQYCGLAFCEEHGSQCGESDQICVREICHRKHADLAQHLVFRDRAWLRNRHGMCGIEGCRQERWGQCSKCQGLYCEPHLANRSENVRQGMVSFSRPASFCEHCLARRKLWSRL